MVCSGATHIIIAHSADFVKGFLQDFSMIFVLNFATLCRLRFHAKLGVPPA
jgi:hypothetical protein